MKIARPLTANCGSAGWLQMVRQSESVRRLAEFRGEKAPAPLFLTRDGARSTDKTVIAALLAGEITARTGKDRGDLPGLYPRVRRASTGR